MALFSVDKNILEEARRIEDAKGEPRKDELETVNALIKDCEEEAATLASALEKSTSCLVSKTLQDKMTQLDERYEKLEARRDELKAAIREKLSDEAIEGIIAFSQDVARGLENIDTKGKRDVLDIFDARVTIKEGEVYLEHSLTDCVIAFSSPLCSLIRTC